VGATQVPDGAEPLRAQHAGRAGVAHRRSRAVAGAAAALLVVALAVRVLAVVATPDYRPGPGKDDRDYDRHACWVASHGTPPVRLPPFPAGARSCAPAPGQRFGLKTAYRPPLWPLALGGAYALAPAHRWTAGRLEQAAIGTVTVGLTGAIAAEVWGAGVGLAALGLGAVCLPLVLDGASLISEPLFVALELGAVLAVARSGGRVKWALGAGALVGLASLTRSDGPVLLVPLLAALWRRPAAALALLAAAALVVAPWTVRNARVLHAFVPISTETGVTLLGTYNEASRTERGCTGCWVLLGRHRVTQPLARHIRTLDELGRERFALAQTRRFVARHPLYVAQVAWGNALRLLELGGTRRIRYGAASIDVPPGAAIWGARELWVLCLLGLAGMAAWRRAPRWLVALPPIFWLFTVLVQSETPRFRAPLDPFVVIAAALGLAALSRAVAPRPAAAGGA
jgi:hypothetical protein